MTLGVLERTIRGDEARALDRVLEPFDRAAAYVAARYDRLLLRFPEQWIAVAGTRVIASDVSRDALMRKLRRRRGPSTSVYVTFLTARRQTLILWRA